MFLSIMKTGIKRMFKVEMVLEKCGLISLDYVNMAVDSL